MKFFKKKIYFLSILLLIPFMITAQIRVSKTKLQPVRTLIKVELQSLAKHYVGICPVNVKMTGKITVSAPVTVKYRFERSDGVRARFIQLALPKGVKLLPFTWKLNKNGQYWVELVVISGGKEFRSGKKEFDVKCDLTGRKKIIKRDNIMPLKQIGQARIINLKPVVMQSDDTMTVIPKVSDLVVKSIQMQPIPGKVNKKVTFRIIVKNISNIRNEHSKACYLLMKFYHAGDPPYYSNYESKPYYYVIPAIASGSEVTIEVDFYFYKKYLWTLKAYADGKKTVHEINEDNNWRPKYFPIVY
ncbi:MAG: hypothetical protein KAR14_13270 [Candidatus Aminicenantes bacterium]|nr:hypothetical protein [Candidatus Aminicenantes bacterium]